LSLSNVHSLLLSICAAGAITILGAACDEDTNTTDQQQTDTADTSVTDTSVTDTSGETDTGTSPSPLACYGDLPAVTADGDFVTFSGSLATLYGTALPDVTIRACARSDRDCQEPTATTTSDATEGAFSIDLPTGPGGWRGFLEIVGPKVRNSLIFFPDPLTEDVDSVLIIADDLAWNLFGGDAQDPTRGAVVSIVKDCDRTNLEGVGLEVSTADDQTAIGYAAGTMLDSEATATDSSGLALAINVPVGTATLTATVVETDEDVARDTIFVRSGYVSQMNLWPRRDIAADWSCMGTIAAVTTEGATIERTRRLQEFLSREPLAGVTVRVCASADTFCENPLDEDVTDARGTYAVTLPNDSGAGFTGYTEYTGDHIQDTLLFVTGSNRLSSTVPGDIQVLSPGTVQLLATGVGVELDDTRGHLQIGGRDCGLRGAPGQEFSASTEDDDSTTTYFLGGLPNPAATSTDRDGAAAITNVPAGTSTLRGYVGGDETPFATLDVVIRPTFITAVVLSPNE
jgi:hypothetical protein